MQKLTAEKVVAFFSQHKAGLDKEAQTESRLVEEADYVEVVRRASAAEQRREEMREQLEALHDQVLTRGKVVAKLQTECDSVKTERNTAKVEVERLEKELKALQRDYKLESLEKGRLQAANKTLRKDGKALIEANQTLQEALRSRNSEVEELAVLHEEAAIEARQVKQELRVVYRQYFQPKLLSSLSKEHRDERRRSIAGGSPKRKTEEEPREEEIATRKRGRLRLKRLDSEGSELGENPSAVKEIRLEAEEKRRELGQKAVGKLRKRSDSVPYRKRPMEETLGLVKEQPKALPETLLPINSPDPVLNPTVENPHPSLSPDFSDSSEASSASDSEEELRFSAARPPRSHHPSHIYPAQEETGELPRDETMQSLASTQIPGRVQEDRIRKNSNSSSITRGLESGLDQSRDRLEAEQSQKEAIDGNRESVATETLRDLPVPDMESMTHSQETSPKAVNNASRLSPYIPMPRNRVSIGVLTDPVTSYAKPTESIGVQFNWEQPETVYEEDGSFKGPDGTRYYVWPVNPNQLYGLSGDVFYHTLQQIFSVSPKIPLNRSGQPHQPVYLLEGTHLTSPQPPESSPPRRPHDPQVCGRDCAHRRAPRRKEERLFPVAKQTLRY